MIVIPMAGRSRRFAEAGYTVPKHRLMLHGRTVFAHALSSFESLFSSEQFLMVHRAQSGEEAFIRAEADRLGLPARNTACVGLEAPTRGQAETVALGLRAIGAGRDAPLTIFNIDTFRTGLAPPVDFDARGVDGYLEVFHGEGEHWSFARPARSPAPPRAVAEVAEKRRISDLCSTGLYYFARTGRFLDLFEQVETEPPEHLQGGEFYVAPLYNEAIKAGDDIRYSLVERDAVWFCGTPHEYEALTADPDFVRRAVRFAGDQPGPRP